MRRAIGILKKHIMKTTDINKSFNLTPDQANDCDAVASQVLDDYIQENYPGLAYELYQDGVYPEGDCYHPATRELDAVYFDAYEKEAKNIAE